MRERRITGPTPKRKVKSGEVNLASGFAFALGASANIEETARGPCSMANVSRTTGTKYGVKSG